MNIDLADWQIAGIFALLSSATFPLGAVLGVFAFILHRKLNRRLLAFFLSVGAGSLIFAVAVEVYAEGLEAIEHIRSGNDTVRTVAFIVQIAFAVVGALLYVWLDRQVNRISSAVHRRSRESVTREAVATRDDNGIGGDIIGNVQNVGKHCEKAITSRGDNESLADESAYETRSLLSYASEEDDPADASCTRQRSANTGGIWVPMGGSLASTQGTVGRCNEHSSRRSQAATSPSGHRPESTQVMEDATDADKIGHYRKSSSDFPSNAVRIPTEVADANDEELYMLAAEEHLLQKDRRERRDVKTEKARDHLGVALVLWASQLVDAIPEAMMIGFRVVGNKLSWAFIISLFIANFPESFSGGYMMKKEGFRACVAFAMWLAVPMLTAIVAAATAAIQVTPAHSVAMRMFDAGMQGTAAGAMLALSTASMLPAAYEAGGVSSGLFCVLGFLFSVSVRLFLGVLEGPVPLGQEAGIIEHTPRLPERQVAPVEASFDYR
ncbi:putative zinc transporter ZIP domain-containing protein [Neospora caninum Liverpool]|uniref:Putative zinc transporter ZIP domain-containing protein n=1 Tax=Neospora caninum (strain Liverpool) TaxID=572307 RepID=F0V9E3_NEOCL|nr:putative zinc transporter ZIP domain-containing protein [Neospora caninum Liverpool]CBZ50368.1 putative zinc transporter ZIP domain-containing protein [Neospora caninum Liverpool]CEL64975.1 TPA: zinc transporter ZIP domain-containing protein,putative [Neospora caninum Liverpool]|eukprot:XP_003880402.1 putative zinc transporter ZIP domain-containing protein [Neospora caninum Liverpool]